MQNLTDTKIVIIGLGYVGLPLALEFSKKYSVIGFDINESRVSDLKKGYDKTNEANESELENANVAFTSSLKDIQNANCYIVTVPTPIDIDKNPDLGPLISASSIVGGAINEGDIVIYESTVYPGATEEVCIPELEKHSGLVFNKQFYVGYSPERINPGDRTHRLPDIKKVTSGSTPEIAVHINELYLSIITAGTHMAPSIKVAEAAKVIENTQRDLNIALINELAIIFNRLGISTNDVLEAAATKWNFLPFQPGLVGGHCIGVDPYYLTHKAQMAGYFPEVILAGRKLNDKMGQYIASQAMSLLEREGIKVAESHILVMGLAFKENCPDIRNTKVIDVINPLKDACKVVDAFDPWVDADLAMDLYNISLIKEVASAQYDLIILAVAHNEFITLGIEHIKTFGKSTHFIYDLKSLFPDQILDMRL
jgi:UDP-N-acetyl-D-glucosamine/UDP-N-acetyl-D-galactosamine dehydrogenase